MCDQAKACSRASLPAGGLKPESPPEAGARVTDFEKKNGFRLHIPPPSAKKSSFFQYTNFSWKIPGKKKKVSSGQLLPSFVGRFPAADEVGLSCTAFFPKQRAISCAQPDREFTGWNPGGVAQTASGLKEPYLSQSISKS